MSYEFSKPQHPYAYRNQLIKYFKSKGNRLFYTHDGFIIDGVAFHLSYELDYVNMWRIAEKPVCISVPFSNPSEVYNKFLRYFKGANTALSHNLTFSEILQSVQNREKLISAN